MIEIKVPARVHVGLIGLSPTGYRINGGFGWALSSPQLSVRAAPSPVPSLKDNRRNPLAATEIALLLDQIETEQRTRGFKLSVQLIVSGALGAHRGLGGGTALRLAAIEALHRVNSHVPQRSDLIAASGRGGTSGIGVRTYFDGGGVFDLGHRTSDCPKPSHAWSTPTQALPLLQFLLPRWRFGVCSPPWISSVPQEDERRLFEEFLPIPHTEVTQTLYHMTFGAMAAILEKDRNTFAQAVDALQEVAWKAAEWQLHGDKLIHLAQALRAAGAEGVGLSSIGPSVFFLADNYDETQVAREIAAATVISTATNSGRTLIESS